MNIFLILLVIMTIYFFFNFLFNCYKNFGFMLINLSNLSN